MFTTQIFTSQMLTIQIFTSQCLQLSVHNSVFKAHVHNSWSQLMFRTLFTIFVRNFCFLTTFVDNSCLQNLFTTLVYSFWVNLLFTNFAHNCFSTAFIHNSCLQPLFQACSQLLLTAFSQDFCSQLLFNVHIFCSQLFFWKLCQQVLFTT